MDINQEKQENFWVKKDWILQCSIIFLFAILLPIGAYLSCKEYLWLPAPLHNFHEGYDCKSCHTPFRGIESEKCSQCHEQEGYAGIHSYPMTSLECTLCHPEHHGNKAKITSDLYIKEDKWCMKCHQDFHKNPEAIEEKIETTWLTMRPEFNHKMHFEKEKYLNCIDCHQWEEGKKENFQKVSYDSCLACHKERQVKNHGNWTICQPCHREKEMPFSFALPKIEKKQAMIQKIILGGNHAMMKEECLECHKGKKIPLETRSVSLFSHANHLPDKPKQEDCLECHTSIFHENNRFRWDGFEVCKKCHEDNKHSILIEIKEEKSNRWIFSHTTHIEAMNARAKNNILYRQGCFACHTMKEGNFSSLLQENLCKKCHWNHQNYGTSYSSLTNCNYCHSGIFSPSFHKKFQKKRKYPTFSHNTSPHRSIDCESCHNQKKSHRLDTFVTLHLQICQKCHNNQEEKSQNCMDCHGYHSFFVKKNSPPFTGEKD